MIDALVGGKELHISDQKSGAGSAKTLALRDHFLALWAEDGDPDGSQGCYGQLLERDGTLVGDQFRLNTHTSSHQKHCTATPVPDGGFFAAWSSFMQGPGGSNNIIGQLFAPDAIKMGPELRLNTYTHSNQWRPSLATHQHGIVAVWATGVQFGDWDIVGQQLFFNGTKSGTEFRINSDTDQYQKHPMVAAGPDTFIVVWSDEHSSTQQSTVDARVFALNGTAISGDTAVVVPSTRSNGIPSVAATTSGFVVVWPATESDGSAGIVVQRLDARGARIGARSLLDAGSRNSPSVAGIPDGVAVVWDGWENAVSGPSDVYAGLFTEDGTPLTSKLRVNVCQRGNQWYPSIASLDAALMVVWGSQCNGTHVDGRILNRLSPTTTSALSTFVSTSITGAMTLWPSSTSTIGSIASSSDSNGTVIALVVVIVGLVLSFFGGAGLFFRQRRKSHQKDASVALRTPAYEEVTTEPNHIYAVLPGGAEQRDSHYSDWPRQDERIYEELELCEDNHYVQNINDIRPNDQSASSAEDV